MKNHFAFIPGPNRIDENIIRQFEQKMGVKIYLNYYESSEELLTKLKKHLRLIVILLSHLHILFHE